MLLRISLIVTILAGIGIGVVNYIGLQPKIKQKEADLTYMTNAFNTKVTELASTRKDLKKTQDTLKQTQATLTATTEERDTALRNLETKTKLAEKVTQERDKALKDLDDTRGELAAYTATGWKPQEIIKYRNNYNNLVGQLDAQKAENGIFLRKIRNLEDELAIYIDPSTSPELPATLKGKVLVMDPKWNFVVLDVGEDNGVRKNGEFLVNRDGKLVAKVRVRTLQKVRCIANIEPGWQLGEVLEGDLIIPARPKS